MNNKIEKYLENLEQIKEDLINYPLEITEGTKKVIEKYNKQALSDRNKIMIELKKQYDEDLKIVKEVLIKKTESLIPDSKNEKIDIYQNKINLLKKVMNYCNEYNDVYDKIGLEKIIYNIDDIENYDLKESNSILLYVINEFSNASVKLTKDDFNYSPDTEKYMKLFFEKMNDEKFDDYMEDLFREMYWSVPNLLTQLKLNVRYLVFSKEKNLTEYCKVKRNNLLKQSNTDEYNFEDAYFNTKKQFELAVRKDPYLNVNQFLNEEILINDYLPSSIKRNEILNKYTKKEDFNSFTIEQRKKFFVEIENLGYSINELKNYRLFQPIINDILENYKNKDKNKGAYNEQLKKIKKLEKERIKKVKKYNLIKKLKSNNVQEKLKKIYNNINNDIELLDSLYNDLENYRIKEKISLYINENSTIYDALKLAGSFYGYLKSVLIRDYNFKSTKEINDFIELYENFIYDPNVLILKNLNLFGNKDLEFLIEQKCKIFGINIENNIMDNIDLVNKDIEIIKKIYDLEYIDISIDDIKLICDVKKI